MESNTTPPGEQLKAWRTARGLSQTEAGLRVEVSVATWSDWENDKKNPTGAHREALEILTGIPGSAWNDIDERALLERVRARAESSNATDAAA